MIDKLRELIELIAAIYARFSSDNQRPESIDDQISACMQYALRNNITVDPAFIFTDSAVSGSLRDRVGFNALLEAAKNQRFGIVLVDDLSRLTRSNAQTSRTIEELSYYGVRLISVSENIDTGDDSSKLNYQLRGIINEAYLDDLSKKTLRGQLGEKQRGSFVGEKTYGYISIQVGELRIDKKGRMRPEKYMKEIVPEQVVVICRIFESFADGKSAYAIAKELNEEGIPSPVINGKGWTASTIGRILTNKKYIGIWSWGNTETKKNPITGRTRQFPRKNGPLIETIYEDLRIISQDLWERVQERRAAVKKTWPGGKNKTGFENQQGSHVGVFPRELLSGSMKCAQCGGAIVKISGKGGGYYGCHKATRAACDNKLIVRKNIVEKLIIAEVLTILNTPEHIDFLMHKVEELAAKMCETLPDDIRLKNAELNDLRTEVKRYVKFIAKGKDSEAIADALISSEQRIKVLTKELEGLEQVQKKTFKAPPIEWIEDRITHIKEVLETKTGQSALLIRKLLGEIQLKPVSPDIGAPYLVALSKLQPLVLFEKKRPRIGPFIPEPDNGSNTLQWWR